MQRSGSAANMFGTIMWNKKSAVKEMMQVFQSRVQSQVNGVCLRSVATGGECLCIAALCEDGVNVGHSQLCQ